MNRRSTILAVMLVLAAAVMGVGCTSPVRQRLPTVAIAIRPVGDRQPSTGEVELTLQALKPALLQVGALIAERRDLADFVMTVSFIPATDSAGSRVRVIGIEPTARLRESSSDGGDTPEMKEWQRRLRQLDTGGDNSPPPGTSPAPP